MDVVRDHANGECIPGCDAQWIKCAEEVLKQNKIHPILFGSAIRELLVKGRGKYRNIMIVGPSNCGKTSFLSPLREIFHTFSNPAKDKYAWVGAEKADIIFLNDFRWSEELISWNVFLKLLEGDLCHLPAPKNHYATDLCIDTDTPIVATGKEEIQYQGA